MNFMTNTFKKNLVLIYCLQTQTVSFMKLKQNAYEKFYEDKHFLIVRMIQSFLILLIKK